MGTKIATFARPSVKVVNTLAAGIFWFIFLITLVDTNSSDVGSSAGGVVGTRIFAGVMLALTSVWCYRGARASAIYAYEGGVVVKTLLRNKRYYWSSVLSFGITEGPINANFLSRRCVLTVQQGGGRVRLLTSFNGPASKSDEIRAVANALNGIASRSRQEKG
jgi:hypothetical protein